MIKSVLLALGLCGAVLLLFMTDGWAVKPLPPLELTLERTPSAGQHTHLLLRAKANIDSDRVELTIALPPEIRVIQGDTTWKGQIQKGAVQALEITIQDFPNLPENIRGKAVLEQGGQTYHQQAWLPAENKALEPNIQQKLSKEPLLEFKEK